MQNIYTTQTKDTSFTFGGPVVGDLTGRGDVVSVQRGDAGLQTALLADTRHTHQCEAAIYNKKVIRWVVNMQGCDT